MCSNNAFQMLLFTFAFSTLLDLLEERKIAGQRQLSLELVQKMTYSSTEEEYAKVHSEMFPRL